MKNHYVLILFAIIGISGYSIAQDTASSRLYLSLGPATIARQDIIFSPFIHKDFTPLSIGLRFEKDKKVHQFLRFDYAGFNPGIATPYDIHLDDEIETIPPHSLTLISLDYGQGAWIGDLEKKNALLGGYFNMDVQAANYQYSIFSHFGYYADFGLGIWYKRKFDLGERHKLFAQAELPVLSWLTRSPYLVNDDENIEDSYSHNGFTTFFEYLGSGHLASWNTLQTIHLEVEYQYNLSEKWSLGAGWRLDYIHSKEPRPLTSVQNNLQVVVGLKL